MHKCVNLCVHKFNLLISLQHLEMSGTVAYIYNSYRMVDMEQGVTNAILRTINEYKLKNYK